MAAAYAAVMTLMNTIDRILRKDRFWRIFEWNEELRSLQENAAMLQTFLEESSQSTAEEVKRMGVRIRDAAHEAHDVIDTYIYKFILESERNQDKLELQKVTEEIAGIAEEVKNMSGGSRDLPSNNSLSSSSPSTSVLPSTNRNASSTMIGFEKDLVQIKTQLVGNQSGLHVILIVGMGGAGKTTLARNVYEDSLIAHHFDVRTWATVSQVYDIQDIIISLLGNNKKLQGRSTEYLKVDLLEKLKGRRYLIIFDDVWDKEFYDDVRRFFPSDNNGSRIILTTRKLDVAEYVGSLTSVHHMSSLSEDVSWHLLKNKVFGEEDFPPELEDIGRAIARDCKGLPLTIVVIGGFLAKAEKTSQQWRALAENLNSIIKQNEEECLGIFYLSYKYLPPHLKPCFLYMGAFPEDCMVRVTRLVHFWMAEGFLKPGSSKSLSEVAHEYLEDLIDRNLILAHERDINGKARVCKIHDILRELCLREAKKESFLYVFDKQVAQGAATPCHRLAICNRYDLSDYDSKPLVTHSLICSTYVPKFPRAKCRSLKILDLLDKTHVIAPELLKKVVNLRYIALEIGPVGMPSSLSQLWSLQTLILVHFHGELPSDIWQMSDLKYIDIDSYGSAPPIAGNNDAPLEDLEIIYGVRDIKWTEGFIRKLPNLKKLRISYSIKENPWDDINLQNLCLLQKLEELHCTFYPLCGLRYSMVQWLPESLKELTLQYGQHPWSAMTTNIGSLPNLQILRILNDAFSGANWEPNEGEFHQLKFLELKWLDLIYWRAESTQFPLLRHLVLNGCRRLMEIPSGLGEIPTLQKIELIDCPERIKKSAKRIQDEQWEDYGNDNLQVIIKDY